MDQLEFTTKNEITGTTKKFALVRTASKEIKFRVFIKFSREYQSIESFSQDVDQETLTNEIAAWIFDIMDFETEENSDYAFNVSEKIVSAFLSL